MDKRVHQEIKKELKTTSFLVSKYNNFFHFFRVMNAHSNEPTFEIKLKVEYLCKQKL